MVPYVSIGIYILGPLCAPTCPNGNPTPDPSDKTSTTTMICPFLYLLPLLSILTPLLAQSTSNSSSSGSTTTSSYSCVDPRQPYAAQVNRGQNTTVCLYVGPSGSWNADITYKRFSVNLVADEFSSYRIPGCELTCFFDHVKFVSAFL
jgi:hypothetical protein